MSADTPMSLKERLRADMTAALRAADKPRLGVLRMAVAAIQQREVDAREAADDGGVRQVLKKMIKQRNEAAEQFRRGDRRDLADKEQAEVAVLKGYLPEPMSDAATAALVEEVIAALAAESPRDMGRVMAQIKHRGGGRVDLGRASGLVRSRLHPR